jgi:hypothetical protein
MVTKIDNGDPIDTGDLQEDFVPSQLKLEALDSHPSRFGKGLEHEYESDSRFRLDTENSNTEYLNGSTPNFSDRRVANGEAAIFHLVKQIHSDVKHLDGKLSSHIIDEPKDTAKAIQKAITELVPNGDVSKHFNSHKSAFDSDDANKKMWRGIIEKTVGGVIWAALGLLALAIWEYVKKQLGVSK